MSKPAAHVVHVSPSPGTRLLGHVWHCVPVQRPEHTHVQPLAYVPLTLLAWLAPLQLPATVHSGEQFG